MKYFRLQFFLKPMTWLVLTTMLINPALALQYQQLEMPATFINHIPDFQGLAWHIHTSQKDRFIAELKARGYDVIPASQADARRFLSAATDRPEKTIQLAANFNLKRVYVDECKTKVTYCNGEECNQYPKPHKGDCSDSTADSTAGSTSRSTRVETNVSISHRGGFELPRFGGGGGNGNDAAAVMLVVIGVVVIAALFIYAGKWVIDQFSNDEDYYSYWWDIGTHFINLDTEQGERGSFSGLKLSGGFVPNLYTNFGISFEFGSMDLDLLYNRQTTPQRIQLQGAYWLLGPQVRWLFQNTDFENNPLNNTYVYLELLGGSSDRDEVSKMAIARIGINTALYQHLRIGFHYGAFYLGLDKDQGFANDGDNYWSMYGFELGYEF